MEGEFNNNNNVEMHQPEGPVSPPDEHRRRVVSLIVGLVVIIAIVVWIGNWSLNQQSGAGDDRETLTDEEKQQILESLRREPGTPPMTQTQKADILKSLQSPSEPPPLTEAQKQDILRSLE